MMLLLAVAAMSATARGRVSQDNNTVTMSNGKTSVQFAKNGKFDILSMRHADGKELVSPGLNLAPWTLTYRGAQGETPELQPNCAVYRGVEVKKEKDATTLLFSWDTRLKYDGGNYPVEMSVTLPNDGDTLVWNLSASLPEGWDITEFKFPTISLNTPASARVITPGGWGNEYTLRHDTIYEANYPSWSASMQMMMLDDERGAYFYSPRDYNACGKLMTIEEKKDATTFSTKTVASEAWSDHKTHRFAVPWRTVTSHHPEGWSAAAKTYYRPWAHTTEWGSKKLSDRDIPQWLVEKDLWMRAKYLGNTTVMAVNRAIDYYDRSIAFHWYFWHNHAYDSHYPDYLPAKPEFNKIIADVRARGCQVMPYINGRLWDPGADSYVNRNGRLASCRRPDGNLYTEIYPTSIVPNTVTCPASPIWHDVILELADSIQNGLGTNGLYIDQIAAAAPYPCYADNHNHPKGGGEFWFHSYRDMMRDLRAGLKPGNIVFSEENAECYIPSFDILLTVNTPHSASCRIVPLYPLIYSDRVLTCAYTYTPYTDVRLGDFRYQNMQCLLYGSQLGWVDPRLLWVDDKTEYEALFLKNLTDFRAGQHDVFIGGEYVREFVPGGDNPQNTVPVFGTDYMIKGAEWLSPAGKRVWYVVNSDSKSHTVTLPDNRQITLQPISAIRIDL